MSTWKVLTASLVVGLALAGCSTGMPIVAGAADTVGVSVSGGTQEVGGSVIVGYRGAKFAVVPIQSSSGDRLILTDNANAEKGFSVFAMLGLDVKGAPADSCVGINQVVAVGRAATTWAEKARGKICQ